MLVIGIAVLLVIIHIIAGWLRFISYVPRSRGLSFVGGISVASVFLHLLPELNEHQAFVVNELGSPIGFIEHLCI